MHCLFHKENPRSKKSIPFRFQYAFYFSIEAPMRSSWWIFETWKEKPVEHAPLRSSHGMILFCMVYVLLAALSAYLLLSFPQSSTEYEDVKPHPLVIVAFLLGALRGGVEAWWNSAFAVFCACSPS